MSTAPSALPRHARPQSATNGADASSDGLVRRLASKVRPELLVLIVVAAALNLINLGINGNANEYYSAAVRSMTESWSNFFFGSFDPAGLQMVDKPPLALWVQAASAKVFGFSTWSFLVPQALMGVATTVLVYDLVRRRFGRAAGFISGLALATTPTAVAVFRHNNPDALLMLCITVALWATVRAFETPNKTRWLVLAGVAVGLGFEAKMAAALMIVPAIVAAWLWVRPLGFVRSIRQMFAFGVTAAVVGLAWPVAVWLTPAGSRPWVSGTSDNSIWSLIFGYNGLGRVLGQDGGPGGGNTGGGPGGGGGAGSMFGGDTGPLRLLNESLGSQGGWLLGIAVGSILVLLIATRLRRADARTGWLIATAGTFAITAFAFSFASGIFHPYYVSALAPFTAALFGAGLATMLGHRAPGTQTLVTTNAPAARETLPASDDLRAGDQPAAPASQPAGAGGLAHAALGETEFPVAPRGGLWRDPVTGEVYDDPADEPTSVKAAAVSKAEVIDDPTTLIRIVGGLSLVAGAVTEWIVLSDATQLSWIKPILIGGTIVAGLALILSSSRKVRVGAVGAAAGLLLVAPTVWAVQTPGHATSGTFPTGGPASAGGMGGPGGGGRGMGGPGGMRGGFGGQPPQGMGQGGFAPPAGGFTPPSGAGTGTTGSTGATGTQSGTGTAARGGMGGPGGAGGGGMFSGDQSGVKDALAYAKANGGGTLVVSGQSGAAPTILSSDADIAGIGGFSGRESEVTIDWFADRVAAGDIRFVLTSSGGLQDSRTGSNTVMDAVAKTCTAVSSVDGLYDCQGQDAALRSAAS